MEKFPILCTLSAVLVFLGATLGVAGVQTVKKNDLPFGTNSADQIQRRAEIISIEAMAQRQDVPAIGRLDLPPGAEIGTVQISGDLLVSF